MKKLAAPSNSPAPHAAPTAKPARSFRESPIRTRRGLWQLADGYLDANVIEGFLRGMMWFVGLFMAFILVSGASKVARAHMPFMLLVQFVAVQMPRLILFTIPSALLFGTVSTFVEMSSRGEITALMAGGMSLRRMLRAPLVTSVVLAAIAFWLQESLVPQCEFQKSAIAAGALQNAKATQIFPLIDKGDNGKVDRIIQADDFDTKNLVLTKPDIRINQQDGTSLHIVAKNAHWDKAQKTWVFTSGQMTREPAPGTANKEGLNGFSIMHFDEQSFQTVMALDPTTLSGGRDIASHLKDHDYEMVSLSQLAAYREQRLAFWRVLQNTPGTSHKDLSRARAEVRSATFGIHDKVATPLIVIGMVLIGAPLGVRPQRTAASGLSLGLSLMVLLGYYLVWTLVSQWGKAGGGQPLVAAYLPFVLLVGLGTFLTWKKS